jgi:hypothetical protein
MESKKITMKSREQIALDDLKAGKSGAELRVLEVLAESVLSGLSIPVDFQSVANIVIAKSYVLGKLPPMSRGRPSAEDQTMGWQVAFLYFQFRDSGMSYADAVSKVSARFHKDERHIMRLVNANKDEIGGDDLEARRQHREYWKLCAEMYSEEKAEGGKPYLDFALEILAEAKSNEPDPLQVFDSMLQQLLKVHPADIK